MPDPSARDYDRAVRRLAVWLVAVGVVARVSRYAVGPAIWNDEAMLALNVADRGFLGLTKTLDYFQVCPVLFLWAERAAFLLLGDGGWALRLVPLLSGVAALGAFWAFARRTVSPTAAVLAVGLLAAARWPVFMSSTVKPYAGDLFWACALLALAAEWRHRPDRLRWLAALVVAVPVAVASSFPVVFAAGAISLYLLPVAWRHPDWRAKLGFVAFNVLLVGTFAGCLAVQLREKDAAAGQSLNRFMLDYWRGGFPPGDVVKFPVWLAAQHTGRMFAYPIGDKNGGSTLTFVLFAVGVWQAWRTGNRPLLALCLVPFGLNFAAAVMGRYPYGACCRLSQHLAPAICLLAGVGWAKVHERIAPSLTARLKWVRVSAVVLGGYAVGQVVFDATFPDHDPVCRLGRELHRELADRLRPGDRIAFDPDAAVFRPTVQDNQEVRWHVSRFRDHALPVGAVPAPADVPGRLWAVCIDAADPTGREVGAAFVAKLRAAGWVPAADAVRSAPPWNRDDVWHNCRIAAFERPGG